MQKIVVLLYFIGIGLIAKGQVWGLDSTFGNGGIVITEMGCTNDLGLSVLIQQDGKIVGAGWSNNGANFPSRFAMVRYNIDGSLDQTFGTNGKVITDGGAATAAALQPDQKILLSGNTGLFYFMNDTAYALLRYNIDGSPDSSFGVNGKVITTFGDFTHGRAGVTVQPDGKIVQSGTLIDTVVKFTLVRFENNGTLDSTFGVNGKVITEMGAHQADSYSLVLQNDGKLILSGQLHNGVNLDFVMIRYHSNGSIDSTFGSNGIVMTDVGGHNDIGTAIAIQPDGKILQTGRVDYNSSDDRDYWLLRYNENGTLDNTFGTGGKTSTDFGYEDISTNLTLLSDGKIIVGGWTHTSSVADDLGVAKFNSDGSIDMSFGTNGRIITVVGSRHDDFFWGAEQSDGKIVLFGGSDRGTNSSYNMDFAVVRYALYGHGNGINDIDKVSNVQLYPNPAINIITLETTQVDKATYSIYDFTGRLIQADTFAQKKQINVTSFANGVYVIQVGTQHGIVSKKFIKQ